jgi:hypothetical protein
MKVAVMPLQLAIMGLVWCVFLACCLSSVWQWAWKRSRRVRYG